MNEVIYELPYYNSMSRMYQDIGLIETYKRLVQELWHAIIEENRA